MTECPKSKPGRKTEIGSDLEGNEIVPQTDKKRFSLRKGIVHIITALVFVVLIVVLAVMSKRVHKSAGISTITTVQEVAKDEPLKLNKFVLLSDKLET
jgi:flagellin-like protein